MEIEGKKEIYRIFSEMTTELLLLFRADGEIFYWNKVAADELGYQDGFQGVNIADVLEKILEVKEGKAILREGASVDSKDGYYIAETVAYRKNQTICPVEVRLSINAKEDIYGICLAASLASQKAAQRNEKKAQIATEEASHMKNEFVANVTHELRTPVNGILGFTRNLLDTEITKEQEDFLKIIENCCHNMMKIINNLLDFSKLEAGKFTIDEKEFKFREFMDQTMETNLAKINEKGLQLMVNVSTDIPEYLIGDDLRLGQILNNLLSNAVKFTSTGQITVSVAKTMETEKEMELFFMVIDTGIGIAEEDKDKLFQSFSQVDASISRQFGGTGLGLSITRELVTLMNGEIDVQSEKGKGSTFSFSVRLKKAASENATSSGEALEGWYTYEGLGKVKAEEFGSYEIEEVYRFGSPDNQKEVENVMEKLVICIEMDNWQKAENFAETLKGLIPSEERDVYRKAFRLEMLVRKGNKEKVLAQYEEFKKAISECYQKFG